MTKEKGEIIFEIHHTVPFSGPDSLRVCDGSYFGIKISARFRIEKKRRRKRK